MFSRLDSKFTVRGFECDLAISNEIFPLYSLSLLSNFFLSFYDTLFRVSNIHVRVDARCGRVNKFLEGAKYSAIAKLIVI